jgi:hypothetical protein
MNKLSERKVTCVQTEEVRKDEAAGPRKPTLFNVTFSH